MGRARNKTPTSKAAPKGKPKASFEQEDDFELDEIDKFQRSRSKIMFSESESEEISAEEEEEEIMKLEYGSSDEEEEDEEQEEEEEEEEAELGAWGSKKKAFYEADKDAEEEEEIEAKRLQKQRSSLMKERDFLDDALMSLLVKPNAADDEEEIDAEVLTPDMAGWTAEEKKNFLLKKSPELASLVSELQQSILQLKDFVHPILKKAEPAAEFKGLEHLKAKHYLLMSYCTNICFYLLLKTEGKSIENHPVVDQLVRIRMLLDKMKPIDLKMKNQIDRYLKVANQAGSEDAADENILFKPNPNAFIMDENEEEEKDGGVYKVPKVAPVYYDEDKSLKKQQKIEERMLQKASKSRLYKDLLEEFSEQPEEIVDKPQDVTDADLKEKLRYEEENFMRFSLSKKEMAKWKKQNRFDDELGNLGDFGDLGKDARSSSDEEGANGKNVAKYLAKLEKGKRKRVRGGDDNEFDAGDKKKKRAKSGEYGTKRLFEGSSDEKPNKVYEDAKLAKLQKALKGKPQKNISYKPVHDKKDAESKRSVGYQIMKNKGLIPKRSKEVRNPRVKQRTRYEAAEKKLSSFKAVSKSDKLKNAGPYSGQHTGIKKDIVRSVKF